VDAFIHGLTPVVFSVSFDKRQLKRFNPRAWRVDGRWVYFGGVAFKYQRPVEDLASAASLAGQYVDAVASTSGGQVKVTWRSY